MHRALWSLASQVVALAAAAVLVSSGATAQVVAVGTGAFAGSSPLNFTSSPAIGTEVNGLSAGGYNFSYSLGAGNVFVSIGPGVSNNVSDPTIVSSGNNSGVLTIVLPTFASQFGFGFALLSTNSLAFGTSVTALNGATSLGTVLFGAPLDPTFAGGFAGINSVTAFDRVQLSFNSIDATAFAIDNLVYTNTSLVPEPSSFLLTACGIGALAFGYRRRNRA